MERKVKPELLVINTQHQRLKPPSDLTRKERDVWETVVNSTDPAHFKKCEAPLLTAYCTAAALARFYSQQIGAEGDQGTAHKLWIENARLMSALASRLRLSPSSRYDARAAERHSNVADSTPPWEED